MCIIDYVFTERVLRDLNDTHMEKLFYSIHYKNDWLAAYDHFHVFTQWVKFYTFHYTY